MSKLKTPKEIAKKRGATHALVLHKNKFFPDSDFNEVGYGVELDDHSIVLFFNQGIKLKKEWDREFTLTLVRQP